MEVRLISKIQSKMTGKRIVANLPDDPGFTHIEDIELWEWREDDRATGYLHGHASAAPEDSDDVSSWLFGAETGWYGVIVVQDDWKLWMSRLDRLRDTIPMARSWILHMIADYDTAGTSVGMADTELVKSMHLVNAGWYGMGEVGDA